MKVTNLIPPGYAGKKQYIIMDENNAAFEWKSNTFHTDKCTTYIKKSPIVMDAVQQSFPGKPLHWAVYSE